MVQTATQKKNRSKEGLPQLLVEQESPIIHNDSNASDAVVLPINALLRDRRKERKASLTKVSEDLRIGQSYLEAIENADKAHMPERVYVLGFVRSYARYLGLDVEEVVFRFKEEILHEAEPKQLIIPKAANEDQRPSKRVLMGAAVAVVACVVVGSFWINERTTPEEGAQLESRTTSESVVSNAEEVKVQVLDETAPTSGLASTEAEAVQTDTLKAQTALKSSDTLAQSAPLNKVESAPRNEAVSLEKNTSSSAATRVDNEAASGADQATALQASGNVWLELRTLEGKVLLSRTLKTGEKIELPAHAAKMTVGNAGALAVVMGEQKGQPLGKIGEVKRDLPLDPEALKGYVAVKASEQ